MEALFLVKLKITKKEISRKNINNVGFKIEHHSLNKFRDLKG